MMALGRMLQMVLLLVITSLIPLVAYSLTSNVALLPHVLVLVFLAVALWGLMIWLIGCCSYWCALQ